MPGAHKQVKLAHTPSDAEAIVLLNELRLPVMMCRRGTSSPIFLARTREEVRAHFFDCAMGTNEPTIEMWEGR